jgi:sterol desaturase/sphingolipid hydroxylase (fatty acid hydroxylase superfamily)
MTYELLARLVSFCGVFAFMASWELIAPLRLLTAPRRPRWFANLALSLLNTLAARALLPTAAVGVALAVGQKGWGVLNLLSWPWWVCLILAVVALDFVVYIQHVLFHAIPLLWRFHMVHHSDLDVDVTTGVRFHPMEILVSAAIKGGAVALIGAAPAAVLVFEALLNATSMFNHSNVRMSEPLERMLRWIVVTPDMHRIHHSAAPREANTNFGFNLPCWDRLLGTFLADPSAGQMGMALGLEQLREPNRLTLSRILVLPFVGEAGPYPVAGGRGGTSKSGLGGARPGVAPSSSGRPR